MDFVAALESLGYTVTTPGDALPNVIFYSGFGLASYCLLDDEATLESLVDPMLHQQRLEAFNQKEKGMLDA